MPVPNIKEVLDFHWVRDYAGRIIARVDIESTESGGVNVYVNGVQFNRDGRLVAHKPHHYMLGYNTLACKFKKEVVTDDNTE